MLQSSVDRTQALALSPFRLRRSRPGELRIRTLHHPPRYSSCASMPTANGRTMRTPRAIAWTSPSSATPASQSGPSARNGSPSERAIGNPGAAHIERSGTLRPAYRGRILARRAADADTGQADGTAFRSEHAMSHGKQRLTHRKADTSDKADTSKVRKPSLDDVWPVHSAGGWPQGLSLGRAYIYDNRA